MITSQPFWSELQIDRILSRISRLHRLRVTALPSDLPVMIPKRREEVSLGYKMTLNKLFEKDFPSRLAWLKSSERVKR